MTHANFTRLSFLGLIKSAIATFGVAACAIVNLAKANAIVQNPTYGLALMAERQVAFGPIPPIFDPHPIIHDPRPQPTPIEEA